MTTSLPDESSSPFLSSHVVPSPLPDELLQGWRGRIAALNGYRNGHEAERLLIAHAQEVEPQQNNSLSFLQAASRLTTVSVHDFLLQHTLVPFSYALTDVDDYESSKSPPYGSSLISGPYRIHQNRALLCQECVKEDLSFWGFSYWRRSHQLPGVFRCQKHGAVLHKIEGAKSFDCCPHQAQGTRELINVSIFSQEAFLIAQRFSLIATEILTSAPMINRAIASVCCRNRAQISNFRIGPRGSRTTISAHIMQMLPREWLVDTFPRIRWEAGKYIPGIDGVCSVRSVAYSSSPLCLVAATLFKDMDDPIQAFFNKPGPTCHRPSTAAVEEHCAKPSIPSETIPVSTSISDASRPNGPQGILPDQSATNPSTTITALNIFLDGSSIIDACRIANANPESLERLIRSRWNERTKSARAGISNERAIENAHMPPRDLPQNTVSANIHQPHTASDHLFVTK